MHSLEFPVIAAKLSLAASCSNIGIVGIKLMTYSIYSDTSKLANWSTLTFFFMLEGAGHAPNRCCCKMLKNAAFLKFCSKLVFGQSIHRIWLKLLIDIPQRSTKIIFDVWSCCSKRKGCSNLLPIFNFCGKWKKMSFLGILRRSVTFLLTIKHLGSK